MSNYVMTIWRTNESINKAETTVASYLTFHRSVRQKMAGNRQD